jgi:hypothetical protein
MKYDALLGSGKHILVGLVGTLEEVKQQVIHKTGYNERGLKTVKLVSREGDVGFSNKVFEQKINRGEYLVFE